MLCAEKKWERIGGRGKNESDSFKVENVKMHVGVSDQKIEFYHFSSKQPLCIYFLVLTPI